MEYDKCMLEGCQHPDKFCVGHISLAALDIKETDLLNKPYLSMQAQALAADTVQVPDSAGDG